MVVSSRTSTCYLCVYVCVCLSVCLSVSLSLSVCVCKFDRRLVWIATPKRARLMQMQEWKKKKPSSAHTHSHSRTRVNIHAPYRREASSPLDPCSPPTRRLSLPCRNPILTGPHRSGNRTIAASRNPLATYPAPSINHPAGGHADCAWLLLSNPPSLDKLQLCSSMQVARVVTRFM